MTERLVNELEAFESDGGRVVLVSQEGLPFDTVSAENEDGARHLAERLVELGYREFVVFAGPPGLLTARDRLAGLERGLAAHGILLAGDRIVHGDFTREGGYSAAGEYLSRYMNAEIIVAVNDVMAVGAMARLREAGLRLPRDLAIAGFDDILTLRDVAPSLTTVQLPLEELGCRALRLALDRRVPGQRIESVAGPVLVRQSTPPRQGAR